MAITTRHRRARVLSVLAASLALASRAGAVDWNVVPSVTGRLSYSDNMHLRPAETASGETIAAFAPGIAVSAVSHRFKLNAAYTLQAIGYSGGDEKLTHNLVAGANAILVEDWLFAGARASISRLAISPFGPQIVDPAQRTGNDSTVKTVSFSPTLRHRFPGVCTAEMRFSHENVSSGNDLLSTRSDSAALKLGSDTTHGWGWDTQYERRRLDDAGLVPVHLTTTSGSVRYALSPRLMLSARAGYEDNDYRSIAGPAQGSFWSTGVYWNPSPRTSLNASFGRRYFGNTYGLDLSHRAHRSVWRLSYSENITSTHGQFLALGPADTAAVLHQLWATSVPDARLRQQQIDRFLGRVAALGRGGMNYFSHRYYLQKMLVASLAVGGSRSTFVVNLSGDSRTAQTSSIVDSTLLGAAEATLFDRTRQRGADALWNMRLNSRVNLNAALSRNRVTSLSTGRTDTNTILRLGLTRQFQRKLSGALELRRVQHGSSSGGAYRENAITASVNLQF